MSTTASRGANLWPYLLIFREAPGTTGTLGKCLLNGNKDAIWKGEASTAHPLGMFKFGASRGLASHEDDILTLLTNMAVVIYC